MWSHNLYQLEDDFGRTVEASLVLHSFGDPGLTRDGFFVHRLTVQDVGELRGRVMEKPGVISSGRQAGLDKRLFGANGSGGDDPDGQGVSSGAVAAKEVGNEDLRTSWIDTDETEQFTLQALAQRRRARWRP